MQPALCVDFDTLSCCMLRHLLLLVLCIFSRLPRWHFRPPSLSLGALLFELSGVIFAPGTTYCHAVCILPCFWLKLCFYIVAQVQLNPGKPFKCLESGCSSACFPGQVLARNATGVIAVTWVHKPPASTCLPVLGFHGMSADWLGSAVSIDILNHSNGGLLAINYCASPIPSLPNINIPDESYNRNEPFLFK